MQLILASTSPRRRELLSLLAVPFEVVSPPFEDTPCPEGDASAQALSFAREKARAVAARHPHALVLGSDTLIEIDGRVVGKPHRAEAARDLLSSLRGRAHVIRTAVCLCHAHRGVEQVAVVSVEVWMRAWTEAERDAYVETGEGLDKAGGYAIQGQGAGLIARIVGDFTAAVGLPLRAVAAQLETAGCRVPVDIDALYQRRPYANWSVFEGEAG